MKNKKLILMAAALLIVGSIAVKPAMAYFTDSHTGKGSVEMTIGEYKIEPGEEYSGMTKYITVKNTGDYSVRTRVKLFAGSTHSIKIDAEASKNWTEGSDGYFYYNVDLEKDTTSSQLVVEIDAKGDTAGEFNVIVIEEATRVYADGTYNWDQKVETVTETEADVTETTDDTNATDEGGAN